MLLLESQIIDALSFATSIDIPEQANKINSWKSYNSPSTPISGRLCTVRGFSVYCHPGDSNAVQIYINLEASRYPIFVKTYFSIEDAHFEKTLSWMITMNGYTRKQTLVSHDELQLREFKLKCYTQFYFYNPDKIKLALSAKDIVWHRREVDTDAEIKVDKETIKVHRGFLSTISPVFQAMFNGDTAESKSGIVVIKDLEVAAVVDGIDFCYGQPLTDKSRSEIMNVFKFVDKYDITVAMEKLKSWLLTDADIVCTDYKNNLLTVHEVLDLLIFTDLYNLDAVSAKLVNCLISQLSTSNFCDVAECAWKIANDRLKTGCALFYEKNVKDDESQQ